MGIQNCKEKCFNKKFSDSNDFNLNQNENFLNYSFDKKNIFNNNFNNENDIKFFIDSFNNNNNNKNILNYIKKVELIQKKFREFLLKKNNKNHIKNQIEIKNFNFKDENENFKDENKNFKNENENFNETESTLFYNRTKNSFFSSDPKKISFQNEKFPHFNLFSKHKIKYKYYGYITKSNKKKIKNGFGKILFSDKSSFAAFFTNNFANGICSYFDNKNGNFVGEYLKNIPNGFGIFSSNLIKITGNFSQNNFSGIVEEKSPKNSFFNYNFRGNYINNKKNGIGTFIWEDGTIYEGEFINNEMTGFCIITFPNNNKFKGEILNSKMNGYGEFYFNNGKKYFGFYKNDKKDGFGLFVWNVKILEAFVGFWTKGYQCGPGIKIKGENFRYGIWNKNKEIWVKGPWEFQKHLKYKNLKYLRFFKMKQNQILKFIFKLIQIPMDEN